MFGSARFKTGAQHSSKTITRSKAVYMFLPITTLSSVALSFIMFMLAMRVIGFRRSEKVSLGDGGKDNLQRAMRGQGNLIEYALFAIVLIFLAELQGGFSIVLAVLAALFVIGRILHGYALGYTKNWSFGRLYGTHLTLWPLLALMLLNLWQLIGASGIMGT